MDKNVLKHAYYNSYFCICGKKKKKKNVYFPSGLVNWILQNNLCNEKAWKFLLKSVVLLATSVTLYLNVSFSTQSITKNSNLSEKVSNFSNDLLIWNYLYLKTSL